MVTAAAALPLRSFFAKKRCKTVAITHGLDVVQNVGLYQKHIVPAAFRMLDAVAAVSQATGEACLRRGLDPHRLHVIPNGIDVDRFSGLKPDTEGLEKLANGLSPGSLLLCSVGRHVKRKGFDWFVEAVLPLLPEHVHYWTAGDGPLTESCRQFIDRNGLHHRVRLLGRISDEQLLALYRKSDLFVMPNVHVPGDMEGFGVVLLEAGLCGLPAVGSDLEGIRDVISSGKNGYLVGSGNARAFADVILRLDENRSELASMAHGVRRYVLDSFSWDAVAGRFVELFRDISN